MTISAGLSIQSPWAIPLSGSMSRKVSLSNRGCWNKGTFPAIMLVGQTVNVLSL
jgi:hypothetical protein